LTLSHWCFVLMGLHLGIHIPAILNGVKSSNVRRIGFGFSILVTGVGLWLFLKNSYPDYLFYRVPFAFIDYDKAVPLVLLEALLIAFFWVFIGTQLPKLLNRRADTNRKLISLIGILLAVAIGMGLTFAFPAGNEDSWNEEATPWGTVVNEDNAADETPVPVESTAAPAAESKETPVDDGFVWIEGGTFLMGSPETENWRIGDETQHEVTIGSPVWWYREPSIIDSFMEAYDFSGKTVVPFATSGGSDIGDSAANLQMLATGAKIATGKRFDANTSADKLADWAKQRL